MIQYSRGKDYLRSKSPIDILVSIACVCVCVFIFYVCVCSEEVEYLKMMKV